MRVWGSITLGLGGSCLQACSKRGLSSAPAKGGEREPRREPNKPDAKTGLRRVRFRSYGYTKLKKFQVI